MITVDQTHTRDFFVIVFFAIIIAYGFIVGRNQSVKVIVATYLAAIAVHGISSSVQRAGQQSHSILSVLGIRLDSTIITTITLFLFVTFIILIAAKGGLEVQYIQESRALFSVVFTALFGFASAGLLLSTLLLILSGNTIFDTQLQLSAFQKIMEQSRLMKMVIVNQRIWFALPALCIVVTGLLGRGNKG